MNSVSLVGRLTKDIELRKTSSNTSVCQFTLAVEKKIKPKDTNAPTADFISCVVWRQGAEFLAKYSHKGSVVGVEGQITSRSYEKNGEKVFVTEVVADNVNLYDPRPEQKPKQSEQPRYEEPREEKVRQTSFGYTIDSDEDLPFM